MAAANEDDIDAILQMVEVHGRVDAFIEDAISAVRARAFARFGARLALEAADGNVMITPIGDRELPAYIADFENTTGEAVLDTLLSVNRMTLVAHWTALEAFAEDVLALLEPSRSAREGIRDRVRDRLRADARPNGVASFEGWFAELGYVSALHPDLDELLRHVSALRNSIAHSGPRPTSRFVRQAPDAWGVREGMTIVLSNVAVDAALNAMALYVAELGAKVTNTGHALTVDPPDILLRKYLDPRGEDWRSEGEPRG